MPKPSKFIRESDKKPQYFWGIRDKIFKTVYAANLDIDTAEDWLKGVNNPKLVLFHHKLRYVFVANVSRVKNSHRSEKLKS